MAELTIRAVSQPPATLRAVARPRCGKLVVFFTRGMSLEGWHHAGILEREIALYRELLSDPVDRLAFVTYGGTDDLKWAHTLPGLEVLPNRWKISPNLYSVLSPWLHRASLRDATVFKANQINGAWSAVLAKWLFGRPLIVRCGYLWADFTAHLGSTRLRRTVSRMIERVVMRRADRVVVAADADAAVVARLYGVVPSTITVIPNYVDTTKFRPLPEFVGERGRAAFVGRLEAQKNVEALIDAVAVLPGVILTIIGDGPLRVALEARAVRSNARVEFVGRVPHAELPALLNRAELFVLPSLYEGNPKALVEAMACGIPVIGAATTGIREVLVHRESGFLCGTSSSEIRAALVEVLNDAPLRARLRDGGLRYVAERCSLVSAVQRERELLAELSAA